MKTTGSKCCLTRRVTFSHSGPQNSTSKFIAALVIMMEQLNANVPAIASFSSHCTQQMVTIVINLLHGCQLHEVESG